MRRVRLLGYLLFLPQSMSTIAAVATATRRSNGSGHRRELRSQLGFDSRLLLMRLLQLGRMLLVRDRGLRYGEAAYNTRRESREEPAETMDPCDEFESLDHCRPTAGPLSPL